MSEAIPSIMDQSWLSGNQVADAKKKSINFGRNMINILLFSKQPLKAALTGNTTVS